MLIYVDYIYVHLLYNLFILRDLLACICLTCINIYTSHIFRLFRLVYFDISIRLLYFGLDIYLHCPADTVKWMISSKNYHSSWDLHLVLPSCS